MKAAKSKPWLDDLVRIDNPAITRHGKIRLDKSERFCDYPEVFHQAFIASLLQEDFIAYPEPYGLKQRVARHWKRAENEIVIGAGIDALIKAFYETYVDRDDEVIRGDPCFRMYRVYANLYAACYRGIGYLPGPIFDFNALVESVTTKTRAVLLANPNSPVGDYQDHGRLRQLLEKCAQYNVPVLLDEAYIEFAPHSAIDLLDDYPNLAIARTFSKAWGAAGIRIGFLLSSPDIAERVGKWRPMYEVNQIGVRYAEALLDNASLIEEYASATVAERQRLVAACRAIGCDVIDSHTNFVHIHARERNEVFLDALDRHGVLYKTTTIPHDSRLDWLRLSVGPGIVDAPFLQAALASASS